MLTPQLFTALSGLALVSATPLMKRVVSPPVIQQDFPDPSPFFNDGTWYVFASQSNFTRGGPRIQVAQSQDFRTWQVQDNYDALRALPPNTIDTNEVWAPDVTRLNDGSYLMYFGTTPSADRTKKCMYTARSRDIRGPYDPDPEPFDCALSEGGSLDASGFVDEDGTRYVTWKIDANSLGNGGSCGNSVPPLLNTPIVIQQVGEDGITKIGDRTTILNRDDIDGPTIEAPKIIKRNGFYILFFSNNCFNSPLYTQSYAYSRNVRGPYTKAARPLYTLGDQGLSGPGGGEATGDGSLMVFHALREGGIRWMHTSTLQYNENGFGDNSIQIIG
ncbi:putative glycosyl hydrolases family 43 protein [Elsinoe australis]|uniref:Putative glycosyl hydrolases family 43 protein n=1 Tax=Elsinoe australis TaxID=40998 RepID=A0A4V6DT73_9PEZI|nr:putative glycosyl hydrolases family 43 protein [Elsinoe australis]